MIRAGRNTDTPKTGTHKQMVKVAIRETRRDAPGTSRSGSTSLLQARIVNEVVKAQTNKVCLARLKGDLIDRPQASRHAPVVAAQPGSLAQLARHRRRVVELCQHGVGIGG